MLKKLKNAATICLALIISFNSISNLYINVSAGDFFLGDGQLSGAPPIVDRIYNIRSFDDTDRYLQALNDGTSTQTSIKTAPYNGAAYQEWKISKVEGTDEYTIQDINSGKYLSILGSASNSGIPAYILDNANAPGQRFKIEQHFNASGNETPYYKILTKSSGYTLALGVDTSTHNILQMDKDSSQTIMALEEASFAKGVPDGYNYIQNVYFSPEANCFLTIGNSAILAGFGSTDPKCEFIYLGNSYYKIMLNDDYCLTVANAPDSSGITSVGVAPYTGTSTQHWRVIVDEEYFKFQPQSAEAENLFLFCVNDSNLILDNSTDRINRGRWRRFISDDYFERFGAYLCGIHDASHSYSHIDWITSTMTQLYEKENVLINYDQIKVGCGYNQSISFNSFSENIEGCDFFVFRGHGSYISSAGSRVHLTPINAFGNPMSNDISFSCDDMADLDVSNISYALFICCESAHGSYLNPYTSDNFISASRSQGVGFAIGFDGILYCDYANAFLSYIIESYSSGETFLQSYRNALMNIEIEANMPFLSTPNYYIYYSEGPTTGSFNDN